MSVLNLFSAGVSAASTGGVATPSFGVDRRLARVAHSIWPDVTVHRMRPWARAEASRTDWYQHDPPARAAELIHAELAARAEGATPDAARLEEMLTTIFETARQAGNGGSISLFGARMRRQRHAVQIHLAGAGTAATGACAQLFGHTPLFTAMILGGLTLGVATVSYIVANLAFDNVPELPGQGFWSERSRALSAMNDYSTRLAAELEHSPEWVRTFPNAARKSMCGDLQTLLRSVWTPGDLRRAAVHRFGRAP